MKPLHFLTSDDKEVKFSLESSSLSEPDTQGEIGGNCCTNEPETIICMMDAYFSYHSDDLDIDLDFYFIQNEKYEEPIENQNIIHSIHFKKSDGSTSSNSGFFEIQPELKSVKPNHKIIDSINLNNQTYYDLIQIEFDTTSTQQNTLFQCSKLLASKGGIVYLQDKKGIEVLS